MNKMEFSEIEIEWQKYFMKSSPRGIMQSIKIEYFIPQGKHNSLASKIFAVLKIKQPSNLMPKEQTTKYMEKFKNKSLNKSKYFSAVGTIFAILKIEMPCLCMFDYG